MAKPLAIQQLTINNVRNLADIQLNPASGINIITGVNGAGKTSLLEAIHILARGRSFRTRKTSDWIRRGENIARVIAKINSSQLNQQTTTVGLERSRGKWQARINGETVKRFGDISRKIPLIVFEPNALVVQNNVELFWIGECFTWNSLIYNHGGVFKEHCDNVMLLYVNRRQHP